MKKNLTFIMLLFALLMAGGCEKTYDGAKEDTKDSAEWSKEKVNEGAGYIKEKTE